MMYRLVKIGIYLFFITSNLTVFSQQKYIVTYTEKANGLYRKGKLIITPQKKLYYGGIFKSQIDDERTETKEEDGLTSIVTKITLADIGVKEQPTFNLSNEKTGMMLSQEGLFFEYTLVKETQPKVNWKIFDEEKMIADTYRCKKAVGDFRGRTYTVWFTEEIPISSGPWKLGGLPGLILEAEESERHFSFNFKSLKHLEQKFDIDAKVKELTAYPDQKPISWEAYKLISDKNYNKSKNKIKKYLILSTLDMLVKENLMIPIVTRIQK